MISFYLLFSLLRFLACSPSVFVFHTDSEQTLVFPLSVVGLNSFSEWLDFNRAKTQILIFVLGPQPTVSVQPHHCLCSQDFISTVSGRLCVKKKKKSLSIIFGLLKPTIRQSVAQTTSKYSAIEIWFSTDGIQWVKYVKHVGKCSLSQIVKKKQKKRFFLFFNQTRLLLFSCDCVFRPLTSFTPRVFKGPGFDFVRWSLTASRTGRGEPVVDSSL